MEKGLYAPPAGLEAEAAKLPDVEVVIIDDEEGDTTEDDSPDAVGFGDNLIDTLDKGVVDGLVSELSAAIDEDERSRSDWEKMYKEGISLLGLKYEERTMPWSGACGAFHPLIAEAVVRFQADTIMETFPAAGPVKTKIVGKQTQDKMEAARRVEEDLNWQVTENMVEFRPEHERMLWTLPAAGSAFKKVYNDPGLGRQTSVFVPPEDVILPYGAADLQNAERITHVMRRTKAEIEKFQAAGVWADVEIGDPTVQKNDIKEQKDRETGFSSLNDHRYTIYECCADLNIKGTESEDGVPLSYVLTFIKGSNVPLAIRRNWREDDVHKRKRIHYVHYQYIPGFGVYGFGLFHLIGGFAKSATSILRQLVDAGTLSNLPGGLKTRGMRVKNDNQPIAPGEFRDVDVPSGAITENIMPLPYKEPSAVLAGLLDKIIEEGRRFAATADVDFSDMSSQTPVGTTLAVLERTLKVMTAVQARVHYSLKQELRLIAELVRDNTPSNEEYPYDVDAEQGRKAKYEDYRVVEIIPVSDPNAATLSQRVVQYQAVLQLSAQAPQIYDLPELHREMIRTIGIKNVEKLIPTAKDMKPVDPVQENQNILASKPVKAFAYQNHEAHLRVHMMAMQDPMIQQIIGQNPQAQALMGAMQAHIAEHVGFEYRNRIAAALGAPMPEYALEDGLPPEMEYQLSSLLAQAAPQVMAQSQQMVAQQQAQKNAQDPVLMAQLKELQIKEQEAQTKAKKVVADIAAKADELKLRDKEITVNAAAKADELRIREQEAGNRHHAEGFRTGVDIGKHRADQQAKREQQQLAAQQKQQQQQNKPKGKK